MDEGRVTAEVRLLSAHAAARLLHKRDADVLKWLADGELGGYRTPGGQWRIPTWALVEFEEKQIKRAS